MPLLRKPKARIPARQAYIQKPGCRYVSPASYIYVTDTGEGTELGMTLDRSFIVKQAETPPLTISSDTPPCTPGLTQGAC